jgi:hypothetical protein
MSYRYKLRIGLIKLVRFVSKIAAKLCKNDKLRTFLPCLCFFNEKG